MRLRRGDHCAVCGRELAAGTEAFWDRAARTVTCLGCESREADVAVGQAGASAEREHRRRREQRARLRFGPAGPLIARMVGEPQSTRAWMQGAAGEVRCGARLGELLEGRGVKLLHDRRLSVKGAANIDHLAIGPGGVTVIDAKTHRGKVRVERDGGLFTARREVLRIGGHDRTSLIDAVERQIEVVRAALSGIGEGPVDVRGALCFPEVGGLPLFDRLRVREVQVDGTKPVADLAARPGPLGVDAVETIWRFLGTRFPPA